MSVMMMNRIERLWLVQKRVWWKSLVMVTAFIFCKTIRADAQDPIYSQPFLSPVYLNPAATGCGENDARLSFIYRRQWWTIPSSMSNLAFSIDKYLPALGGGVGLLATQSTEGYLNKSGLYASYAYHICAGTKSAAENGSAPKWFWTGGLQFGMARSTINYNNLVFADQLNVDGFIRGSASSATPPIGSGRYYPDFAAGTFFNYNFNDNNRLLLGFSGHHINTPDESLTYTGDSVRSVLPARFGANFMLTHTNDAQTWSYSIAGMGYKQAYNKNLQIGAEVTQNDYDITLGMWYRMNLNDQFSTYSNVNTFSVTLAINLTGNASKQNKIKLGIGHDAELRNKAYSYTTGSTELGCLWDFSTYDQSSDNPCKPKISSYMCPAF